MAPENMPPLAVSRSGLLKSFLMSLSILVAGAAWLSWSYHASFVSQLMWLGLVLVVVWSTKFRLLVQGVAVEFTDQGLTDYTTGLGFIAWSEIVSVRTTSRWFGEYVEFEVKDRNAVLARLPWLKALMLKSNLRRGLPGFSINAGWVSGGAEAIITSLKTMSPAIQT